MKILITGATGFIGSYLAPELGRFHDVVPVDRPDGDLTEVGAIDALILAHLPDVVVHLAAKYGRLKGELDPAYTVEQNALATTRVAQACGGSGVRLVYASTSEVYGDHGDWTIREADTYVRLPHNVYGLSKRWGEEVARLYAPDRLLILRLNMPYGPGQEGGWGACALINVLERALAREPIVIHRGAERSWCYVTDTVRAVRIAIEETDGGVFNVGRDDNALPMVEVARMACDLTGAPYSLIHEVDAPASQTVVKRLSTEKLRMLGWRPEVELAEGMQMTLERMREEPIAA